MYLMTTDAEEATGGSAESDVGSLVPVDGGLQTGEQQERKVSRVESAHKGSADRGQEPHLRQHGVVLDLSTAQGRGVLGEKDELG